MSVSLSDCADIFFGHASGLTDSKNTKVNAKKLKVHEYFSPTAIIYSCAIPIFTHRYHVQLRYSVLVGSEGEGNFVLLAQHHRICKKTIGELQKN